MLDENGNRIVDLGMLKAQRKRSVYGEQIRHQSWLAHEFQALKTLHAAGADVPQPYEMGENAILIGFIGDELTGRADAQHGAAEAGRGQTALRARPAQCRR